MRVIVLTTFDMDEKLVAARDAGASGFLVKDIDPEDLREAVRRIADGEAIPHPATPAQ